MKPAGCQIALRILLISLPFFASAQPSPSYLDRWLNSVQEESRLTRAQMNELEDKIDQISQEQRQRDEQQTAEIVELKGYARIAMFLLSAALGGLGTMFAWLWNRRGVT